MLILKLAKIRVIINSKLFLLMDFYNFFTVCFMIFRIFYFNREDFTLRNSKFLFVAGSRTFTHWSEEWRSADDWLSDIEQKLIFEVI